jgi:hypothetical protein
VRRTPVPVLAALLVAASALAGCSSGDGSSGTSAETSGTASPPATTRTLEPIPEEPLSGGLEAELQQSSRDVALGRFQVWITNGLDHQIRPRRVVYEDELLSRPELGGRLRAIPSGSYRGFTLDLIRPRCAAEASGPATVTVEYGGEEVTVPVEDETHVTGRWADERCAELAMDRIATLEWSGVQVQGSGADAVALFQLTATPTGRAGSFTVDTANGTPLYTSADGDFWTIGQEVSGTGRPVTMELPARPARCDIHAFGSATGGTTFFVNLTIHGKGPGTGKAQIRLAMSPEVTNQAFAYAGEVCGF